LVDASSLESAHSANVQGRWVINPVFRKGPDGINRFNAAAAACHAKTDVCPTGQLAIVVDGNINQRAEHQRIDVPTGSDPDLRRLHRGQRNGAGVRAE
jgi:hypothetical protein